MRYWLILITSLTTTACAQLQVKESTETDLYLRADFTYWEAKEDFKFVLNQEAGIKYLKQFIQYDGQPYQFVIADRGWSSDKNCGYANGKERVVKYNQWLALNCNYDRAKNAATPIQKPFELLPKGSGKYLFELKYAPGSNTPTHVRVSAIKSKSRASDI